MNIIKQAIENKLYSYNTNDFMPIYYEGHLTNRNQFIAYKAHSAARTVGKGLERTITILDDILKPAGR